MKLRNAVIFSTLHSICGGIALGCGANAWAMDPGFNALGGEGPVANGAYYSLEGIPQAGGPNDPGMIENRLRVVGLLSQVNTYSARPVPEAQAKQTDIWGVQAVGADFHTSSNVPFPGTGISLSRDFWAVEGGLAYRHPMEDVDGLHGRELDASLNLGSPSDRPFDGLRQVIFQANLIYRKPSTPNTAWLFIVNWSNNRSFANYIPLPGVAYSLRSEDKRLNLILGFPFIIASYDWGGGFLTRASFFGISQFSAEASQAIFKTSSGPVAIYGAFDWGQRIWLRADRSDDSDRLFFDQKKAGMGLRSPLGWGIVADLSAACGFGRRFFEAESYYSSRTGSADLTSGASVQLVVSAKGL